MSGWTPELVTGLGRYGAQGRWRQGQRGRGGREVGQAKGTQGITGQPTKEEDFKTDGIGTEGRDHK